MESAFACPPNALQIFRLCAKFCCIRSPASGAAGIAKQRIELQQIRGRQVQWTHSNRRQHVTAQVTSLPILTYPTSPIEGQKTGTSGLRIKTCVLFERMNYLENWAQALFDALGGPYVLQGRTLVIGGDGRFYNRAAAQMLIRMAAANGIAHVVVGANGILTTPAVASLIPQKDAVGGLIMTASHNPGGFTEDWGIKYNTESGAPASEALTDNIYKRTLDLHEYKLADLSGDIDLSHRGSTVFDTGNFIVEVIDSVDDYLEMLQEVFDFDALRALVARPDFSMLFDAMHASTGEYARRILVGELFATSESVINGIPLEDFGGGHPDPNLTYAADLVDRLNPTLNDDAPHFGAASDGDGDRNMILGRGMFVNPADSVAVIAANAVEAIPYFAKLGKLSGVARSMPTSSALDRVAKDLDIPCYETPTGWKYFTNLMDEGMLSICGEESFGTSSDHIREKDGLWAVLAWLSILALKNKNAAIGSLVTVQDILLEHWRKFGRTYTMRHDYEGMQVVSGAYIMDHLRAMIVDESMRPATVRDMDEFEYTDPIDGAIASQQGIRVYTHDGDRIVYRLSGTGSAGATIRIYYESHIENVGDDAALMREPTELFASLVDLSMEIGRITEFTDRETPTVCT
jgi:phosphoglucomutase